MKKIKKYIVGFMGGIFLTITPLSVFAGNSIDNKPVITSTCQHLNKKQVGATIDDYEIHSSSEHVLFKITQYMCNDCKTYIQEAQWIKTESHSFVTADNGHLGTV